MTTRTTKNPAEANLKDNAPDGLQLSDSELADARSEGAKEDVKENAKESHHFLTDGNLPGEAPDTRWLGHDEIQPWAHNLDVGEDEFQKRLDATDDQSIPDVKVYGLLALERNGRNRTNYVKAMMKKLKLKADEIPGGGPGHTNDQTAITKLED